MRKEERTGSFNRLRDWVKRTETEFVLSLPAKVYPCAEVMQMSRSRVKSTALSVDGHSVTLYWVSLEGLILSASVRPAERKDRRREKMSTNSFTRCKDSKKAANVLQFPDYFPRNSEGKLPAIAVSGPFGAVKEQSSGLYAQHMAERGFLTIAFDPSFTGESGGEPRRMASPDINTEDFLAAVDFLSNCDLVDPERIGIIGICGFGGMAVNAAALDPRIKATVASTMYDMSKVNVEGYFASEDAPWFVKDYHAYYRDYREIVETL